METSAEDAKASIPAPLFRVFTFGAFTVEHLVTTPTRDEHPVLCYRPVTQSAWGDRIGPTLALFKLLLCAEQRHAAKGELAGALWPDAQEENARHSLAQVIRQLRRLFVSAEGVPLLEEVVGGDGLVLAPQSVLWADCTAFDEAIRHARHVQRQQRTHEAFEQWQWAYTLGSRGAFLADDAYYEWSGPPRRKYEQYWPLCLQQLAEYHLAEERFSEAEEVLYPFWCQHLTDEETLCLLMQTLCLQGSHQRALDCYAQSVKALADELDTTPAASTTALADYIRRQRMTQSDGIYRVSFLSKTTPLSSQTAYEDTTHPSSALLPLIQSRIMEAIKQLEGTNHDMDALRRATLTGLLGLLGERAVPFALWEQLVYPNPTPLSSEMVRYFQHLIENSWGLSNAGEWTIAEQVLHSFLPDVIRHAVEQREAAMLAAQGLVLRSILMAHQMKLSAMVPLCQQAVLYAKETEDHTILCTSLNGLAVAFKYNQQFDLSLQTYQEALKYCDEQASPLIRSRIYAGAAAAFARQRRQQEADQAIHLAYESFPDYPEQDPQFLSTDHGWYMIAYYEGLMHLTLNQPVEALKAFEQYKQHAPTNGVPRRNELEIINYQGRAAILSHQLDLYVSYLESGMRGAVALQSKKRLDEAITIFQEDMPYTWQKERLIKHMLEHYPMLLQEVH